MNIADYLKSKGRDVEPGDITLINNETGRVSRVIEKLVPGGTELIETKHLGTLDMMGYRGITDGTGQAWHGAVAKTEKEAQALANGATRAVAEEKQLSIDY